MGDFNSNRNKVEWRCLTVGIPRHAELNHVDGDSIFARTRSSWEANTATVTTLHCAARIMEVRMGSLGIFGCEKTVEGLVTVWPMFYMQVDSQSRRRLLAEKEVMSGVEWSGERWWRVEKTMSRVMLKEMSSCGRDKGEQEERIKKKEKKMKVKKEWVEGRWGPRCHRK